MKILKGSLTETRYEFPQEGAAPGPMKVASEKTYHENQVAYMADELGLHRISNQGDDFAVSLHRKKIPQGQPQQHLSVAANILPFSVHSSQRSQKGMSHL